MRGLGYNGLGFRVEGFRASLGYRLQRIRIESLGFRGSGYEVP